MDEFWPLISDDIQKSLEYSPEYTLDSVYHGLKQSEFVAWAWHKGDEYIGTIVTQINELPAMNILWLVMMGGKFSGRKKDYFDILGGIILWYEHYALENECDEIRTLARNGLHHRGFDETHTLMVRRLRTN